MNSTKGKQTKRSTEIRFESYGKQRKVTVHGNKKKKKATWRKPKTTACLYKPALNSSPSFAG